MNKNELTSETQESHSQSSHGMLHRIVRWYRTRLSGEGSTSPLVNERRKKLMNKETALLTVFRDAYAWKEDVNEYSRLKSDLEEYNKSGSLATASFIIDTSYSKCSKFCDDKETCFRIFNEYILGKEYLPKEVKDVLASFNEGAPLTVSDLRSYSRYTLEEVASIIAYCVARHIMDYGLRDFVKSLPTEKE